MNDRPFNRLTAINHRFDLRVWRLWLPALFLPTVALWVFIASWLVSTWPRLDIFCALILLLICLFFVGWHVYLIFKGEKKLVLLLYLVLNIIILLIIHPLILGLPGRIGETVFQVNLHSGLARTHAVALRRVTLGSDAGVSARATDSKDYLEAWYTDWATLCLGGGKHYVLHFGKDGRLQSWGVEEWTDGC